MRLLHAHKGREKSEEIDELMISRSLQLFIMLHKIKAKGICIEHQQSICIEGQDGFGWSKINVRGSK